jgi:hypothetical protein
MGMKVSNGSNSNIQDLTGLAIYVEMLELTHANLDQAKQQVQECRAHEKLA